MRSRRCAWDSRRDSSCGQPPRQGRSTFPGRERLSGPSGSLNSLRRSSRARNPVSLELFRPVETLPALELPGFESGVRGFPRIERLGLSRGEVVVGVRRPGDWVGRFEPPTGFTAVAEAEFRKAWPELPESPLSFAGSARGATMPPGSLAFGPAPLRRVVRPDLRLTIESGRIAVKIDAEVEDKSGSQHSRTHHQDSRCEPSDQRNRGRWVDELDAHER